MCLPGSTDFSLLITLTHLNSLLHDTYPTEALTWAHFSYLLPCFSKETWISVQEFGRCIPRRVVLANIDLITTKISQRSYQSKDKSLLVSLSLAGQRDLTVTAKQDFLESADVLSTDRSLLLCDEQAEPDFAHTHWPWKKNFENVEYSLTLSISTELDKRTCLHSQEFLSAVVCESCGSHQP